MYMLVLKIPMDNSGTMYDKENIYGALRAIVGHVCTSVTDTDLTELWSKALLMGDLPPTDLYEIVEA